MWIPLFGVLLAGIVAMQVEVLKLNAGIGRSLERGSALQARNELLRAGVAQLSDQQRIERIAAQMGMIMPAPEQLKFVSGSSGTAQRAVSDIHVPDATSFLAQLPTIGAPAAPQGTSVNTGVGLAAGTTSSSPATGAATGTPDTTGAGTASSGATPTGTAAATPTGTAATTQAGTTGTTPTGTTGSPSTGSGSTSSGSPVTPVAPATSTGATDQSGSSSGGVGATPVGG